MQSTRTEHDALGELQIPADALYGIHTRRAIENFPLAMRPVHPGLIHAYGTVKLACAQTIRELGGWKDDAIYQAVANACGEMRGGLLDAHILVDALQGGAGTSTNMNVNEVLANRALQCLGLAPGRYDVLHPVEDLNRFQSTNDTYPTALRLAAMTGIQALEHGVIALQEAFEERETAFAGVVKVGRTELQDAVLTTMGRTMGAFAEAFGRDRWRLYKCEERLRVVNLGGTAIGTGLGAPRAYIFRVTEVLRALTGFGLARAENLVEATQNADVFAEVSGILKACAVNLLKIAGDIRLMASGPDAGLGELSLPPMQAGSSIMPGKINPVIPEAVSQAALRVFSNDQAITTAAALGNLELNAFMPLIADSLLDSITLLTHACNLFARRCIQGLSVHAGQCARHVNTSVATATALVEPLGYREAEDVLSESRATGSSIADILEQRGLMTRAGFAALIAPDCVTRLGSVPPLRTPPPAAGTEDS
jgi:aspartate ammonia-lyase